VGNGGQIGWHSNLIHQHSFSLIDLKNHFRLVPGRERFHFLIGSTKGKIQAQQETLATDMPNLTRTRSGTSRGMVENEVRRDVLRMGGDKEGSSFGATFGMEKRVESVSRDREQARKTTPKRSRPTAEDKTDF